LLRVELVVEAAVLGAEAPQLVYLDVAPEEVVVAGSSNLPLLGAVEEALAL
jgi:hypothetical protein